MKKLLISLMITVFALSVFSAFALADSVVGSADLIIEADTTNVTLDSIGATGTINLTIKIKPSGPITFGNISFKLKLPDGNFSIKSTIDPAFSSVGLSSFENGVFLITSAGVPISSETTLGTAVVTIQNEAASTNKTYEIGFEEGVNLRDSTPGGTGVVTPVPKNLTGITVTHGPNGHNHSGSQTLAPTCTTQGTMHYTCPCGDEYDDSIPATGHELTFGPFQWADAQDGIENDTAKVHVTCSHGNCKEYGNSGKDVDVPKENIIAHSTGASCTEASTATYEASLTIKDEYRTQATDNFDPATQTWTVTDNSHKHSNATPLGHQWSADNINWSAWDKNSPETPFNVTLKCGRCDVTLTKSVTATKKEASHLDPTCEKDGKDIYEATVDFTGEDKQEQSKDNVPKNVTHEFTDDPITIPATGHVWKDDVTWTWEGNDTVYNNGTPTAKATVMCTSSTCDSNYDEVGWVLDATVEPTETHAPTCTDSGSVTFTATAITTGGDFNGTEKESKKYTGDTKEDYSALGHKLDKVTYEWPSLEDEAKTGITGLADGSVTAIATCANGCGTTLQTKETVKVTKVQDPENKWKDATYLAGGVHTYKAESKFDGGASGELTDSEENEYVLRQLSSPTAEPTVNATPVVDSDAAIASVKESVNAAVESVLHGGTPAGLSESFIETLKKAGAGNGKDAGEEMTVSVVLEQQDTNPAAASLADPNAAVALDTQLTDASTTLYHGIDIKITVSGGDTGSTVNNQVGYISQIAAPVQLQLPISEAGDGTILFVARYHDNAWSKLPTGVSGTNLTFSSDKFSAFAAASSSSIAYADVSKVSDVTYNGKAQTPKPTVTITTKDGVKTLEEGKDYTLSYSNNTNVGTATITITALADNNFGLDADTVKTVTFNILAKPAAASNNNNAKTAPETGDETPVALYAGILTLSVAALAVVCIRRKKTH